MNWTSFAKYARASALINMGGAVVYADSRGPECRVYSTARSHECALAWSRAGTPPTPDLEVDLEKISGTLVFAGAYHHCVVPWDLVWAVRLAGTRDVTDGLIVWPESVPADVEPELVTFLKRVGAWRPGKSL